LIHDMPFSEVPPIPGARLRLYAAAGWLVAVAVFVSPLCALSTSLFCAGVAQRLLLVLVAAPLLALALPPRSPRGAAIWSCAAIFLLTLWFWHMPRAYDATFTSEWIYWSMQASLLGTAVLLWRELLHHPPERSADALAAVALTFLQMALLGAMLTVADRPLFKYHVNAVQAWDLTALQDQHLGGLLIGVPAVMLLLYVAARALGGVLAPGPAVYVRHRGPAQAWAPTRASTARAREHTDSTVNP
jgi:putative membrane protein